MDIATHEQTITVPTRIGDMAIQAVAIDSTPFAYHLTRYEHSTGPTYDITHLPTGDRLPFFFDDAEHCQRFVSLLMEHKQRWERYDYTDTMKRLCKQAYDTSLWARDEVKAPEAVS